MNEHQQRSLRHVFHPYATERSDGTFSGHVSHTMEGRPEIVEHIHDTGVAGNEAEALDEAHAFIARYIDEHPDE